jgi:hypothetical protein
MGFCLELHFLYGLSANILNECILLSGIILKWDFLDDLILIFSDLLHVIFTLQLAYCS